jgi:microtubule-associated protein 9
MLSILLVQKKVLVLLLCLKTDQDEDLIEHCSSLKSNENEESSVLTDCVIPELEKPKESEVAANDLEEEKKARQRSNDDSLLSKSQSILILTDAMESAKVFL